MEKKQKNYAQVCFYCKDPIVRTVQGNKYIFPVPRKYGLKLNMGVYACPKCAPTARAEQREEGHLVVAGTPIS
ncbi:MAG: hypothetical protein ACXABY_02430 [Candidatus Thorarchaeota archaeon]|jgi:hypothetical protein